MSNSLTKRRKANSTKRMASGGKLGRGKRELNLGGGERGGGEGGRPINSTIHNCERWMKKSHQEKKKKIFLCLSGLIGRLILAFSLII